MLRGKLRTEASTRPDHSDPRLRGRSYSIPFDRVWREAIALVEDRGPRWALIEADDQLGRMSIEATTAVFGFVDDVEVRMGLDSDGQTRVDVTSRSRTGNWDLGTNARRIRGFFRDLDRRLSRRSNGSSPPSTSARRGASAPAHRLDHPSAGAGPH